jgi:outer membrane murein-binding lipoprotein Lpp
MKTVIKIVLGIVIAACVLIGGCVALIGAGVNEASKQQDKTAITSTQFASLHTGMKRSEVMDAVGNVEPGDAQEFESEGLPGTAIKSSCIYYNEKGKSLGDGRYFQLCFDSNRLSSKNSY